jgi:uncharacterized protein YlxP (DUF503 family)
VTIGVYAFELHLPRSHSLKEKRQVLRRTKDRLRSRHNVSVAEMEQHADLWQRAALVVVAVASQREMLARLFETIQREVKLDVPGEVIETGREFIDIGDELLQGWTENML